MSPWVRKRKKNRLKIVPIAVCMVFCAAVILIQRRQDPPFNPIRPAAVDITPTGLGTGDRDSVASTAQSLQGRPVYPYSVVRGGASDRYELAAAMARDPVVAAHYAGFDIANARTLRLGKEVSAYVSYRIRNRVLWTSRRVPVRAGELLLTDGRELARTRCANRIALDAQEPTSPDEPASEIFDLPEPGPEPEPLPPTRLDIAEIPPFPPLKPITPDLFPPPSWPYVPPPVFPPIHPHPPGVTAVPEPGTLALLASGLVAGLAVRLLKRG